MQFRFSKKTDFCSFAHYNVFFENKKIFQGFFSFQQISVKISQNSISQLIRETFRIFDTKKIKKTFQQGLVDNFFFQIFNKFFKKKILSIKKYLKNNIMRKFCGLKLQRTIFFDEKNKTRFFTFFCQ